MDNAAGVIEAQSLFMGTDCISTPQSVKKHLLKMNGFLPACGMSWRIHPVTVSKGNLFQILLPLDS